ncbi:hypothetical protein LZ554_006039 [Drepanopeziza brunnea f. sp. 'monogermtubi']|nr:hypothetical protein LZ554_006039 [Drepanopeziza brunnea f. sp. 'monogermtubi']
MKFTTVASIATLLAAPVLSAPTDYTPPGGWESVDYPDGTGEDLGYYPPPPGGWENVKYPPGTGSGTGSGQKDQHEYTSTFSIVALGAEVRNGTAFAPGPLEAKGLFYYGINSKTDTICWEIILYNVIGDYQSPARTATHIHEAARGASGPPRLAFPNPVGDEKKRVSTGCMTGPFTTGILANGVDTGTGFKLARIEANPAGFFTDCHTKLFPLGLVRGQFA